MTWPIPSHPGRLRSSQGTINDQLHLVHCPVVYPVRDIQLDEHPGGVGTAGDGSFGPRRRHHLLHQGEAMNNDSVSEGTSGTSATALPTSAQGSSPETNPGLPNALHEQPAPEQPKETEVARRLNVNKRQFPELSAKLVCDFLRQKNMDRLVAADAAYDLLGFSMSHATQQASASRAVPKDLEVAKELDAFKARLKRDESSAVDHSPPDWLTAFLVGFLARTMTT